MQGADPLASAPGSDTVVLAGGCFWGMQAVFQHVHGVHRAISGYAGGEGSTAQYESVGTGQTGHAESVQLTFDPSQVSLAQLLRIYFSVAHDPTQVNRQGPDQGSQYRSAIFYHDDHQALLARRYVAQLENGHYFGAPIATQILPLKGFYAAEAYHQDYATLHPDSGYIARFDLPKLEHLRQLFPRDWMDKPVLVSQH
ncbi:MAG: peptide-methionine (S)-S-oxide reductase MsrA [Pseudomonadota bacterium]|nr:peptide-methionine (S)-S-oxide reductase MsrA [Pseudomonadota bacterium]